ncbi:hypothetical protein Dda_7377 [Drechslerella dactyloides]|uniref:Major facilitator superfamily (MFS) profile domain-containing protein n=1 Tax=Drechslerella dactyloides TaxID=74499 RepID=A0AAD6IWD1_DREDA|nr:hypothetical protein Dda_7377 [Drechslerella dactyloides]
MSSVNSMEQETDILATEEAEAGIEQQLLWRNRGRSGEYTEEARTGPSPYDGAEEDVPKDNKSRWAWLKRPSITMLLPPFLLQATAMGAAAVPRVNLYLTLVCQDYYNQQERALPPGSFSPIKLVLGADNPECEIAEIAAKAAMFTLYINVIVGLLSEFDILDLVTICAISSPRLGQLSDRYGRRRVMVLTSSGSLISEIVLIFCAKFPDSVTYWWLLLASVFEGALGSFTLTLALTHSYASDCTSFAQRASAFSLFHGCLFLGIAIGPAIGGVVIDKTDNLLSVFYAVVVIHVLVLIYIGTILPESVSKSKQLLARDKWAERQRKLREASRSSWWPTLRQMNVLEPLNILWPKSGQNLAKLRLNMILLAAIDFIMFGVGFGAMTVVILYSKIQFHWTTKFAAYYTSIVNSTRVFALFVILTVVVRLFRKKPPPGTPAAGCDALDTYIIRGALSIEIIGYSLFVSARNTPLFVAGGVVQSLGGIGSPTLQSALTKHSPADKTGHLLGVIALLHALARVIGPTAFNGIYYKTAETYPQATFTVLVALFVCAWVASWFITPHIAVEGAEEAVEREDGDTAESQPLVARS